MSSSERTKTAPFQELKIIGMDPLPLWDRLGGGWDLLKQKTFQGTIYRFVNQYPYSYGPRWVVAVNVRSGEIEISGPRLAPSKTNGYNLRLYQSKKIDFYSADGKKIASISQNGVTCGDRQAGGPFPIDNPPVGRIPPKGRF